LALVQRPYGLWLSPLQAQDLALGKRLKDVAWDSDGRTLVWLEGRGPNGVLVCQRPGQAPRDLNTAHSVRAQVGYGGGDFTVSHGHAYFAERSGRLYRQPLEAGPAAPITPAFGHAAAPVVSRDGRYLVYVHTYEDTDRLAVVDTQGQAWPQSLTSGADFYMQPVWHPNGRRLAWIEWDQPQMPWDGTRLVLGEIRLSTTDLPHLTTHKTIAGSSATAIFQPSFSPDGRHLAYISDQRGWSNLWLHTLDSGATVCLTPDQFDIGRPAWVQGMRVFSFRADGRVIYFTRNEGGARRAYALHLDDQHIDPIQSLDEYSLIEQPTAAPRGHALACTASSAAVPTRIVSCTPTKTQIHARSTSESLLPEAVSVPQAVSWAADDTQVHGLYYPPTSTQYCSTGLPPLIVNIHGGPTAQAEAGFEPRAQYFATRGYAYLDVNYRGSSGYGRAYMTALRGQWGLYDIEDAVGGASYLIQQKLADPDRLIIAGGSAGGYTVLRALTLHPGFFRAGLCLYGISNLFTLAADTHKFEARYLDALLGPLPEASAIYRERSPLFSADAIQDPVAIFQGSEDQVVPPSQAEAIVASLRRRNVPHEYHLFEDEGHGWRKPETIERFYTAAEAFLKQYILFA